MKRIFLALLLTLLNAPAWAACSTLPFTLLSGDPPDNGKIMANFNTVNDNCGGGVGGPATSVVGNVTVWNDTTGTATKDGGTGLSILSTSPTVTGPGSGTNLPGLLNLAPALTGNANGFSKGYNFAISDSLNVGTGNANYLYGMWVEDTATNPITGGRVGFQSNVTLNGVTAGTTTYFNVANAGRIIAGGTDATGLVNVFGGADQVWLPSGSSGYSEAIGREINVDVKNGAAAPGFKVYLQLIQDADDNLRGTALDSSLAFGIAPSGTAPGWANLITFGDQRTWWVCGATPNCTLINAALPNFAGGPAKGAITGIDFTGVAFSGFVIKHDNFQVLGTGTVDTNSVSPISGDVFSIFDRGFGTMLTVSGPGSTIANFLQIAAVTTGQTPSIQASGSNTDISINFVPKGAGVLKVGGTSGVNCPSGVTAGTVVVVGGLVTHC